MEARSPSDSVETPDTSSENQSDPENFLLKSPSRLHTFRFIIGVGGGVDVGGMG